MNARKGSCLYRKWKKAKQRQPFGWHFGQLVQKKKVYFAQFVKGQPYAEIAAVNKFLPPITARQFGLDCFILKEPTPEDIKAAKDGLLEISRIIKSRGNIKFCRIG